MIKDIFTAHEDHMKKSMEALKREYASLRAGRATPALLDKVMVDYYGTPTPVNQVAKVSVPEPRMIMIQPWEKYYLIRLNVVSKWAFQISIKNCLAFILIRQKIRSKSNL